MTAVFPPAKRIQPKKPRAASNAAQKIRIIGGQLRGSKISVPDAPGLRPTSDRARETLFNWLGPSIQGMRVLDLFAGTGALGIEAISRGATWVDFVESAPALSEKLATELARLKVQQFAKIETDTAQRFLARTPLRYDLVFLDPPFAQKLWVPMLLALKAAQVVDRNTLIYVESPRELQAAELALDTLLMHREAFVGAVRFGLYRCA